jgi:hypothetical protein
MTRRSGIQSLKFDHIVKHLAVPKMPDGHDCILDTSDDSTLNSRADSESCKLYRVPLYHFTQHDIHHSLTADRSSSM